MLDDRIKLNEKKIKELNKNIEKIDKIIYDEVKLAREEVKKYKDINDAFSRVSYNLWREKSLSGLTFLINKSTGTIDASLDKFLDLLGIFFSKWSRPFVGFVFFIVIVLVVFVAFGKRRNNNNIGTGQQATTSDNIFDYNSYLFGYFTNDTLSSFTDVSSFTNVSLFSDLSLFVTNLNEGVKSLTEVLPDDIARENDENSRGADNLYHFNGRDLNISNNVDNYNVNAVYSIYKPTNIIQKNFELHWKKVKQDNINESKYVLDCQGDDKKEYLEANCSLKIKPEIVEEPIEPEKEIYIKQI